MDQQSNHSSSMSNSSTVNNLSIQQTENSEMFKGSSDGWVDYSGNKIKPDKNIQVSSSSSNQSEKTQMKRSFNMEPERQLQSDPALVNKYIDRILTCPYEHICSLKTQQDLFFYQTCTCLTDFKDQECIKGKCLNECYLKKQSLLSQKQNLDEQQTKSPRKLTKLQQTFLTLKHCECRATKFKCLNDFYCACKFNGRNCTKECYCDIRICENLNLMLQQLKKKTLEKEREKKQKQESSISSESNSENGMSNGSENMGFVEMDFLKHCQSISDSQMMNQEKEQMKDESLQ